MQIHIHIQAFLPMARLHGRWKSSKQLQPLELISLLYFLATRAHTHAYMHRSFATHTYAGSLQHTHTHTLKTNMSAYSALHFSYFGWKVAMPPLRMLIGNALNLTFFSVLLVMRHNGFLSAAATFGFSADYRITCDALKSGRCVVKEER